MRAPNSPDDAEQRLELQTCDLSALIVEDARHWVSNAVVQCIAATDAGPRIDRNKLQDLVERHFDALVRDNRLDFTPILNALCRIKGVNETTLYIGVVNLQQRLASLNIEMALPDMRLDQSTRAQLLREAHEATERARAEREQFRLRGAVQDLHRAKLGTLLVSEGLITEAELAQALELQVQSGGRLGSNLVQLGFVNEADLARFLGRQLGLPCVTEIRHVSPEARRAVPHELLLKYRLVPLSIDAREIQIAMVDPTDLVAVDEIGFVTDRRVRTIIAPELVVDFARARFFGIRSAPRLLAAEKAPSDGPPHFPPSFVTRGPTIVPAPDQESYELAEFAHDLMTCEVEDDVQTPLWRLWSDRFHLVARFDVQDGMVYGRRVTGVVDRATNFTRQQTPACNQPVMDALIREPRPYGGSSDPQGENLWLSEALGLPPSAFVWLMPVCTVKAQTTSLLLGHLPRTEPPDSEWLDAVWTALRETMRMVQARRALRRVQTAGRPTVHRVASVV